MSVNYTTKTQLEDAIQGWVSGMASPPLVIWQNQKAPQNKTAYVTLNLTSPAIPEHQGWERQQDGSVTTIIQRRQASLNIQAFGLAAFDWICEFAQRAKS